MLTERMNGILQNYARYFELWEFKNGELHRVPVEMVTDLFVSHPLLLKQLFKLQEAS